MEVMEKEVKEVIESKFVSEIAQEIENGTFDFMYEIEMNRKLSSRHVNKLRKSILDMYVLLGDEAVAPIYVVKRHVDGEKISYILDGQHRVKACLTILKADNLDIKLNIITLDGDRLTNKDLVEIISTFNSNSVKWNNMTYIELFAKMKTSGYKYFLELIQSKNRKYFVSNMAHLYTGSQMGLQKIKRGEKLDIMRGNEKRKQFDDIVEVFPKEAISARNLRAVTTLIMLKEYDHDKFLPIFQEYAKRRRKAERFPQTESEILKDLKELLFARIQIDE